MSNDLWRTPPEVFNHLNREFQFIADMACTKGNKLCGVGFTEEDDSLSFDWFCEVKGRNNYNPRYKGHEYVWLNCPYSNPLPWVYKAIEAQLSGLGVVMLLNADTSVKWYHEALTTVSEIRFITGYIDKKGKYISGRIPFLGADGKPCTGNSKAQFILVFNPFDIGSRTTKYIERSVLYT